MQTDKSKLEQICNEYEVQLSFHNDGCIIFYNNTLESDVIPFDDVVDTKFILNNFEMVADMSKLNLNMYELCR